ncbi:hypothetical protein F4860DRAFT_465821 [Xylaria cubensis]|nr:hypothetical protein F4860DRAFT_465821 [Xylaria cubensis]
MYDRRFSASIDSLVEEDPGSHHGLNVRSCEAYIDSGLSQAPSMVPQHSQPRQTTTATYEPMPSQTSLPTLTYSTESSGSSRSSRKIFGSHPGTFQTLCRAWYYGWVAESFGCCLAVIALSAMIITLRLHENKPLTTWPFSISINSFIAVFGVILKAGLTVPLSEGISQLKWKWFEKQRRKLIDLNGFDAASRGPWGSFLFLFSTYGEPIMRLSRPWLYPWSLKLPFDWNSDHTPGYFARFAALLTVLMMAVDPFMQQVVVYTNCPHISTNEYSLVARTNHYRVNGPVTIITPALYINLDSLMAVAINTGMVNPPPHIPSLLATDCKSGNCTFGTLASVGLCRSCEDITSQFRNVTGHDQYLNFTMPGDSNPSDNDFGFKDIVLDGLYSFQTQGSLLEFFQIRIAMGPSPYYPNSPLSAFQCSVTPCVRKFRSFISKNILSEVALSSAPMGRNWKIDWNIDGGNIHYPSPNVSTYRLATSRTPRNGSETGCAPSEKEGPGLIEVALANIDAAPQYGESNETTWYPEDCVWSLSLRAANAISEALYYELDGLSIGYSGVTGLSVTQSIAAQNMWRNGTMNLAHINDYMQKLVDVITATMRNNGFQGRDEYARGQVHVNDTCITVRWAWLAYPATLVGLTIIFLSLLILQGPSGSSSRAWKSSILAPLFISMDEATYDPNHYDMSKYEMNQLAEQIHTQLIRDPAGKAKFL